MSEVQIPSTSLRQFFNDPRGGNTIDEAADFIQPSIDVREFLYRKEVVTNEFTTVGGQTFNTPIQSGAGIYRVKGLVSGYIRGSVTAAFHAIYLNTPNGGSPGIWSAYLAASEVKNIDAFMVDIEIEITQGDVDSGYIQMIYSRGTSPTAIDVSFVGTYMRVR